MTDAFRCNGCGEYWDDEFRFMEIDMDTDTVRYVEGMTLDDIPTEAYGILEDRGEGHFCPDCGMDALADLVERFGDTDD